MRCLRQMSAIIASLLLLLVTVGAAPAITLSDAEINAAIESTVGGNGPQAETVIKAFQQAVIAGDKPDVAAFIRYPIVARINGRRIMVRSESGFVKRYDEIMQPEIVNAVKQQKYGDIFVNYQGVMFGDGQVWLHGVCLDQQCQRQLFKVITLQTTESP